MKIEYTFKADGNGQGAAVQANCRTSGGSEPTLHFDTDAAAQEWIAEHKRLHPGWDEA